MKTFLMILCFASSWTWADVDNITLKNEDGKLGVCAESTDIDNWGYILNSVNVDQSGDDLSFTVIAINLKCRESEAKVGAVAWAIHPPAPTLPKDKNGNELDFIGVSGLLFEADGYRKAQYSKSKDLRAIETYTFTVSKRGLQNKIDRLKEKQQMTLKYVFGLRALYQKSGNSRQYESFSGRFGIYLTWARVDGQIVMTRQIAAE